MWGQRLVARRFAQQVAPVQKATSPVQYGPPRRECVAHAIQSLTDLDSRATVLSIIASVHST